MDTQIATAADIADLDSILGDLDITVAGGDQAIDEIIEAAEDAIADGAAIEEPVTLGELVIEDLVHDEATLSGALADLDREEAYQEQESELTDAQMQTAAAPAAATTSVVVPAKPKAARASTPRTPRDMNSLAPEIFVLEGDARAAQADLDAAKAAVMASVPGQKKVAEKFENLFTALAAGKAPSTFITQAFQLLEAKGTISSADLVACYKTPGSKSDIEGYNDGTARSQAGQIMALFDTVKIATRTKQSLELNKASNLAAKLRAVLA